MKTCFAEVIVDISRADLDRTFSYRIPEALADRICPGAVVKVPFGARTILGCVVAVSETPTLDAARLRDILEVITDDTVVESSLVALAVWMKDHNGGTLNQALRTVMPRRRKVRDRLEKTVVLTASPEAVGAFIEHEGSGRAKAQARALAILKETAVMPAPELIREAGIAGPEPLLRLEEKGFLRIETGRSLRRVTEAVETEVPPALTENQKAILDGITREWTGRNRPSLLVGVTGSGKTLVYMALIEKILAEGRQAIVLIPEIALTYQTVNRFQKRFGNAVSFLHSRLSDGEKYDQFRAAREGCVKVMVGPRSALFTPFPKLGLIILDEEHEESYHSETVPRYHARETAIARAGLEDAHVVMGSATPSVKAYYEAENGRYARFFLTERYGEGRLPDTVTVDMREELRAGCRSVISRRLRDEIALRLEKKEQVMLFLNRRGLMGFVSCRSCGYVEKCPHCDVSLTQHGRRKLVCHYCGYEKLLPDACPSCSSTLFGGMKVGTEMVEKILEDQFPGARILRMDKDTTRGKAGSGKILKSFADGEADILIGTQMIVKGHDFPNVTLMGILLADLSLNDSDYRSAERTFQLVMQAVGRAGRGRRPGLAVIQSYDPEHYSLVRAAAQDYDGFYREEMAYRRMMRYPPVSFLLAIHGSSKDEVRLEAGMGFIRRFIERIDPSGRLGTIGPTPESIGKVKDVYRRVIYIRHTEETVLREAAGRLERYIGANKGFDEIAVQFDFYA